MMNNQGADVDVADLQEARSARDFLDSVMDDVRAAAEPDWQAVTVPAWRNREVWVRGLTLAERVEVRRKGYKPVRDEDGELHYEETGELELMLLERSVYVDVDGRKQKLFRGPDARAILKRQRGGALDELVAVAMRLSGFIKGAEEEAKQDFLSDPTNSLGSDSLETWE